MPFDPRKRLFSRLLNKSIILTAEEWFTRIEDRVEPALGTTERKVVGQQTKNFVEASDKQFKTTFLLRLALAISCGRTVYPALPVPRPRKVLYLHGELSPDEIKERTITAAEGLPRPLNNFVAGLDFSANLFGPGQGNLREIVAKHKPEDLVIDPLQGFMPGADENSFQDISNIRDFIDELIARHGITVWMAVHTGKDGSRGIRGHSSWAAWRDALFQLQRDQDDPNLLRVKSNLRWARPIDDFCLEFKVDPKTNGGTLWPTARQFGDEEDEPTIIKQIIEHLEAVGGQSTRAALETALDKHGAAVRMALNRAKKSGRITIAGSTGLGQTISLI